MRVEGNGDRLPRQCARDFTGRGLAPTQIEDQSGSDVAAFFNRCWIDAALKAETCIGVDASLTPGCCGFVGIEVSAFNEDIDGLAS